MSEPAADNVNHELVWRWVRSFDGPEEVSDEIWSEMTDADRSYATRLIYRGVYLIEGG